MAVTFNPFRPAYLQDPYPYLAQLRAAEPVHWSADLQAWVVTSYDACLSVLQDDDAFSSDPAATPGAFGTEVAAKRAVAPLGSAAIMGNSDPPVHTHLRSIVNRGFTPRVIESMRGPIESAVDEILDELPKNSAFDLVPAVSEPLAVSTVLRHLGIPLADFGMFRQWSLLLMRARAEGDATPGVVQAARQAEAQMIEYLAEAAERRDAEESEDTSVFGVLLDACDEERIDPGEMAMMLIHVSLAGNGPTAMALANAVNALGTHPDVRDRLAADASLAASAVEELLRFDSSTHFVVRFARKENRLGNRTIRAGQQVHVMVGAANRDPSRFPEPDSLIVDRPDNRHLSFGFGIHFCLGAPLARLELQVALSRFVQRFPEFSVARGERLQNYQVRGFQQLVVRPGG